jgi:hypothetical protein
MPGSRFSQWIKLGHYRVMYGLDAVGFADSDEAESGGGGKNLEHNFLDDADSYVRERNSCLERLLELVKDDSASNGNTADSWKSLCEDQAQNAERYFNRDLDFLSNFETPSAATKLADLRKSALNDEKKFFTSLAAVNSAWVRDRLVKNREDLSQYTENLSQIWDALVRATEDAEAQQQKVYDDVLQLAREAIAEEDPLFREKAGKVFGWVLSKGGSNSIGDFLETILGLPDGTGGLINVLAEMLGAKMEEWVAWNKYLQERMRSYLDLLRVQEGAILPALKGARDQVYSYWNENGTKTSRVWTDRARESLDSWENGLVTDGQKSDGHEFSKSIYDAIQSQWRDVESIGKSFEEKWQGVFLGTLKATVQDKLSDAIAWKESASALLSVGVIELAEAYFKDVDEIYSSLLEEPLRQLQEVADRLLEGREGEKSLAAMQALSDVRSRVTSELAVRFKAYVEVIKESYKPLEPDAVQRLFDRTEFADSLKNQSP